MAGFIQFVTITAKPGQIQQLLKHVRAITAEVAANEPRTLKYYGAQSKDNENVVHIWEEYDSDEALAIHRQGKAYGEFSANRDTLFGSDIKLDRLTPL
ncbi:hypothetical protein CI109_101614 [Kwoniella shandongensis]|uniref:Uncharacterized protein n=1 Tax=Kwoniella shandongensis TaxID=1734106 RepID=A0A5M6C5Q3_9TREE|nr:uncharacterized protein CI109_001261 [Kwoniella shandongensis]KAA5530458.1 hypothetical protein CI109_001261 [Kwoniella shandongensis]